MDDNNFPPNPHCFSRLIEVMILANDLNGIEDIFAHMEANNLSPSPRSLRRLALYYAKRSNEEKLKEVTLPSISSHCLPFQICEMIKTQTNRPLPTYFQSRLFFLKEKHQLVRRPSFG